LEATSLNEKAGWGRHRFQQLRRKQNQKTLSYRHQQSDKWRGDQAKFNGGRAILVSQESPPAAATDVRLLMPL
jgi:hypothetical protein